MIHILPFNSLLGLMWSLNILGSCDMPIGSCDCQLESCDLPMDSCDPYTVIT